MLQWHYQLLSKMSVDSVFDADWKEEVEENVNGYSSLSEEVTDSLLDKEIEKDEIAKWLRNLKNSKISGSDGIVGELQEAYDSVWHDGLWYKLWDMGVKGRMWRVIKKMYI